MNKFVSDTAFERHEIIASISFRTARDTVEIIARHPWIDGDYFCERDAQILEDSARNIRKKLSKSAKG